MLVNFSGRNNPSDFGDEEKFRENYKRIFRRTAWKGNKLSENNMDKEKVIEEYFKNSLNKSRVAELLGVSRERIGQIIKEVYGKRNPLVNYASEVNWKLFNDIKKTFGMSTNRLARKAGCTPDAVRHILINDKRWSKNHTRSASNASVKLGKAILDTAEKKLEKFVTTLDKLEKQI